MSKPRLRGNAPRRDEPYPLGEIPDRVIVEVGRQLVHRIAVGQADISGDDFGTIFANAVGGEHRASPLGIADVVKSSCAWSVKTVKAKVPTARRTVRLVSGRNSPDYSFGITDARADLAKTGSAVLSIWNARVNEVLSRFNDLRIVVLVRNFDDRKFLLFENEARRYATSEYEWRTNERNNLEGVERLTKTHRFTWQPTGSQFTVIREVPASARSFAINVDVPQIQAETVLSAIGYEQSWIALG